MCTTITNVLPTIDSSIAVEDLFPPGVGNGQQILLDYVTVGEGGVVETGDDNDFLSSAPPLKSNDAIRVRLVEDVNVVATDRAQSAAESDEILIKAKERLAVSGPLTDECLRGSIESYRMYNAFALRSPRP